jgi:hypothetical protein
MRSVNARTESRLHCYNDYASARRAATSTTNKTFGGPARHARDQMLIRVFRPVAARQNTPEVPLAGAFPRPEISIGERMAPMKGIL